MYRQGYLQRRDKFRTSNDQPREPPSGSGGTTRPSSRSGQQRKDTGIEGIARSSNPSESSSVLERVPIKIALQNTSVAFLGDGQQFVSGDMDGKIRYWRTEDGQEIGTPIDVGSAIRSIATSPKWIVAGTESGQGIVWNVQSRRKVKEIKRTKAIKSVDISSDETKLATLSDDECADLWSLPDGKWLRGKPNADYHTAKFSPDGSEYALAYPHRGTNEVLGIYDSQTNNWLRSTFIHALSIAWASDNKQLFVLSPDAHIHCLDTSSLKTLDEWPIHSTDKPTCISLSRDGALIAASASSSVSFWDTVTHRQIGSAVHHPGPVYCMAISSDYRLLIAGGSETALWDLWDVLSAPYHQGKKVFVKTETFSLEARIQLVVAKRTAELKNMDLEKTVEELRAEVAKSQQIAREVQHTAKEKEDALESLHSESVDLKRTVKELRVELAKSQEIVREVQRTAKDKQDALESLHSESVDLKKTVKELRAELTESQETVREAQRTAKEKEDALKSLHSESVDREKAVEEFRVELTKSHQIVRVHKQKHECETMYADGHVSNAANSLFDIKKSVNDNVKSDPIIMDWLSSFASRCITALELMGDEAEKPEEALATYATALSLGPSSPDALLTKWASIASFHRSTDEALDGVDKFGLPKFDIYRTLCNISEGRDRVTDAIDYYWKMQSDLESDNDDERQWGLGFRRRCAQRLEGFANTAFSSHMYDEADKHLSTILSLDLPDRVNILIKRCNARAMMKSWDNALKDADEVIKLSSSSHRGYELKHAALHGAQQYVEAVSTFDKMLVKLRGSPDAHTRKLSSQYTDARPTIRRIIHITISNIPRVLIDTTTGHLLGRTDLVGAFEMLPIFNELVSSMTRVIDKTRIRREIEKFYRYVMFSHRWGHDEPLFQQVVHVTVYELEASHGNIKLQKFCSLVRQLGFRWAWSDTCCIDKKDNVVLQESLVAMFAWYHGSSLTIIHLCDVSSESEVPDDLRDSIWNTRVWTRQEYVAAKRVLFYTQDWKPYLGLSLDNHKASPLILRQMEVPQVSTEEIAVLHPGLDRVREKLYLASTRETTLVEDIAYSLLGILKASIPVIYGEGTRAVGRLLECVLTGSGDATILAWTGIANEYNSCLPINLTVYNPLVPPHIPRMAMQDLDRIVSRLRSALPDLSLATALYNRLNGLPSATLAFTRLRLPCIRFSITALVCLPRQDATTDLHVYRAETDILGAVEITTAGDLNTENEHCLVHPWIRPLLDQEYARGTGGLDKTTRALRLVALLKQSFGALLFKKVSRADYRRVATDSLIMVQIRDEVSLTDLVDNIDTIEVL